MTTITTPSITENLRKFIQLMALRSDPLQQKWIRDEQDLTQALDIVKTLFHETERMKGKKMYQGQPFDPIEDVKRGIEEYLLGAREYNEIPLQRKRNLTMYYLVVEPIIESFKGLSHQEMLEKVDGRIEEIVNQLMTMPVRSHYDDAIVAKEQIRQFVRDRDELRKEELAAKKKGRRKSKKDNLEWLDKIEEPVDDME